MKSVSLHSFTFVICAAVFTNGAFAQTEAPERPHLDAILEKRTFSPEETAALNKDADPAIDVRDLVIFLNEQPISATFGSAETLAFHSEGSVTLPVYFTKPVPSATTIKFDLGGNAVPVGVVGLTPDYTLAYIPTVDAGATSHQLTVNFTPQWKGTGGEKIIRLTINRNPALIPQNGTFSSHVVRVRQFDAGELVGMLTFPPGSGLPSLPVRIGLTSGGSALCAFEQPSSLIGTGFNLTWSPGSYGFPAFPGETEIAIPGEVLMRTEDADVSSTLTIARMDPPYDEQLDAYLEGFPEDDKPALYHATFVFHDLIAAGANMPRNSNPYAVTQQGRLTLQPIRYSDNP